MRSRHSKDTVSEIHSEAPQGTVSERLAQGPYVADIAGFEPATLQTKGDTSTNEQPRPNYYESDIISYFLRTLQRFMSLHLAN